MISFAFGILTLHTPVLLQIAVSYASASLVPAGGESDREEEAAARIICNGS